MHRNALLDQLAPKAPDLDLRDGSQRSLSSP
jgi:hypothetical protein